VTNIQYHRIIVVEYIICFFASISVGLSIAKYEFKDMEHDLIPNDIVLMYILFCTVGLMIAMYTRYILYLEWYQARSLLTEFDNLVSTGWWKDLTIECMLMLLTEYPHLQHYHY
jgi:hypothetical protein